MLRQMIASLLLLTISFNLQAFDHTQLAVWANEAIIATYTYDHQNFMERQKEIAKYFSAKGWIDYSNALIASKLPETIKNNAFQVSAVATLPPTINEIDSTQWEVVMPILVLYKNPQYQQKQSLQVSIRISKAIGIEGIRGLSIESLQAKEIAPPCECKTN